MLRLKNGEKDPIIKNMMTLASGTAGAQLLGLIFMPLVIRLYSPEDFGILAIFSSMLSLFTPFATFRYTVAIPLPKQTTTALNLMALCTLISGVISVLVGLVFLLGAEFVFPLFSANKLIPYWWLIALALLATGLYEILIAWSTREKHFGTIAKTKISQSLASTAIKLSFGWLGIKPFGLLLGQVVSQTAGIGTILSRSKNIFLEKRQFIKLSRMIFLAKRYSDFPRYQILSKFLLSFSVQTPLMFVAWMYDSSTTGQLSLALMILSLPVNLIGKTMGQAYYGEIAKIGKRQVEQIKKITRQLIKKLFLLSLLPFIVLLISGEFLFTLVFGEEWMMAGQLASSLALLLITRFISSPFVNVLNLYEKQAYLLQINLVRLTLMGLIFGTSTYLELSIFSMIWTYSVCLGLHYLYTLKVILQSIK